MRRHPRFTSDDELAATGEGLLDRKLPKAAWTHAAHFAATLWILRCRPDVVAERDLPAIIRAYNVATGGENTSTAGYHETITQASIRGARAYLDVSGAASGPGSLYEVCNALLASPLGQPDWLLKYWTRERLFSAEARRSWCDPDLEKLPF